MVTKITISQTPILSADLLAPNVRPTPKSVEKEATDTMTAYKAFAYMLGYIQQYPATKADQLFNMFLAPESITARSITKTKRTYSSHGITITEEDK